MAFPVIPVAATAAAAGLGYLLFFRKAPAPGTPGAPGAPAPKPGSPGTPGAPSSTDMPADIRAAYQELLARGRDPDAMEIAADKMESVGFRSEAQQLRARAAQLRAQRPSPPGPLPVSPIAPPAPVAPAAPALPILPYQPDLSPLPTGSSSASYYYDPSNGKRAKVDVRADARALRFLGYTAPADPGGGGGLTADRNTQVGSWHPAMLDAVRHFQSNEGLSADGYLGPATLTRLGQRVSTKNQANSAANMARGVTDVTFSGVHRELFGKSVTMKSQKLARVCSSGGIRMRVQPQRNAGGTAWAPAGALVQVLQVLPGEKSDPAAPGLGGWAFVSHAGSKGWIPSEWVCPEGA